MSLPVNTILTCIFCNTPFPAGRRGEDVIPDWYAKAIGRPVTSVVIFGTVEPGVGISSSAAPRPSQTVAAKEFRLTTICPACNNEWMSQIEGNTKSLLLPMMDGNATNLDAGQQRLVACWAQLKAITYDRLARSYFSDELAGTFRATRPLREMAVVLGHHMSPSPLHITFGQRRGFLPPEYARHGMGPVPVVRVTVVFNHLILSITHAEDGRVPVELLSTQGNGDILMDIWPPRVRNELRCVSWPPQVSLTEREIIQVF